MIIYQAIKNFILAIVVCHKYGLTYKPFCSFNNAECYTLTMDLRVTCID